MTRMYDKKIVARIWRMGRICSAVVIEKCKRRIENGGGVIWDMVSPLPRLDYSRFSGVYPLYILIKLAITCRTIFHIFNSPFPHPNTCDL